MTVSRIQEQADLPLPVTELPRGTLRQSDKSMREEQLESLPRVPLCECSNEPG